VSAVVAAAAVVVRRAALVQLVVARRRQQRRPRPHCSGLGLGPGVVRWCDRSEESWPRAHQQGSLQEKSQVSSLS
jgi:hypothetical protein